MPSFTRERQAASRVAVPPWTTWAAVAIALIPSAIAVWVSAGLVTDVPWGDHLTLVRDTGILEGVTLESLFRFHNEHLIVPTRLAAVLLNGRLAWTLTFPILMQHVSANFFVITAMAAFALPAAAAATILLAAVSPALRRGLLLPPAARRRGRLPGKPA